MRQRIEQIVRGLVAGGLVFLAVGCADVEDILVDSPEELGTVLQGLSCTCTQQSRSESCRSGTITCDGVGEACRNGGNFSCSCSNGGGVSYSCSASGSAY